MKQIDKSATIEYLSTPSSLKIEELTESNGPVLTLAQIAKFMNVSEKTIYRLCTKGEIPFKKVRGQYRFHRAIIEGWLKGDSE